MMREGFDMSKKQRSMPASVGRTAFLPAITPLEAAVLPAAEKRAYGTLSMIPCAYDAGNGNILRNQRTKIWVR